MEILTTKNFRRRLKEFFSTAEEGIKIASAWVRGKTLEELLEVVKDKPVKVELILRASEFRDLLITDEGVFKIVKTLGGKVYLSHRLHAKFILIDRKLAVVGSANLTENGLSEEGGNIEVGIAYTDRQKIEELERYFNEIKTNHSIAFAEDLLGFTLNPAKPESFEFILLEDGDTEVWDYVEIRLSDGEKILALVDSIYSYDIGFFANPFTSYESKVFAPFEDFVKIFANNNSTDWKKASVYAYLNENGKRVKIATAKVLGVLKDGRLEEAKSPADVGSAVYRASVKGFEELKKRNLSHREMGYPVRVGYLKGSEIPLYVDAREVISKHMLVLGTTGSGKSYFVKTFLGRLVKAYPHLQVFVLDPHGEYWETLRSRVGEEKIEHITFEDTLFFTLPEAFEEFLTSAGLGFLVSGNSNAVRHNKGVIRQRIKPFLNSLNYGEKGLLGLLEEFNYNISTDRGLFPSKEEVIDSLKGFYGEKALSNQGEDIELILRGLESSRPIVVFNLRNISDALTRVNLAGLIMQELFRENKLIKRERLLVLEEAHNFAPERAYGDVSAGKDNLALVMARKIASEGRKFNLGLVTITQRPAQVSKYILAQMNTQVMFKTVNRGDIETIEAFVEYTDFELLKRLPSLATGEALFSGSAVPFTAVGKVN
jgi:energy-coupling factor transporter ATP-binding protein EcfA2